MTWVAAFVVWFGLVVIVGPVPRLAPFRAEVGQMWTEANVDTPFDLAVKDTEHAIETQLRLRAEHPKIFIHDPAIPAGTQQILEALLADVQRAKQSATSAPLLIKKLRNAYGVELPGSLAEFLLDQAEDPRLRSDLLEAVRLLYEDYLVTNDKRLLVAAAQAGRLRVLGALTEAPTTVSLDRLIEYPGEVAQFLERRAFAKAPVAPHWRRYYTELLLPLIRPNIRYSENLTAKALHEALEHAERKVQLQAGDRVVTRGERLSLVQVQLLDQLATKLQRHDLTRLLVNAFFLLLGMAFVGIFAKKYSPDFAMTPANISMLALPTLFGLAVARFVLSVSHDLLLATFAYPAGLVGMLGVILFEPRLAVVVSFVSALAAGLALQGNVFSVLVGSISALAGVFFLYSVRERREVLLAGLRLSVLNVVLAVVVALVQNQLGARPDLIMAGMLNGLACYVLAVGGLPLIEALFGIVTDVRLMELTSIDHPLMRLLEERAPGSYQHVLNVTKLAEPAAERIGANYLLVRAGAYFHDVGKALKPKYFTENQVTPEERRIHSKMSPYLSCLIIKNHVREGIELARRYRLPQQVIDFIPQHHGTSLIKYFYEQACRQAEATGISVDEDEFRYPGPKPQSREAAIVMLADTVEATATAKFTGKTVREEDVYRLVRQAIQDKFSEGQFDECPMTFKDLHEIFEVFAKTLLSRYHRRVDYPQPGQRRTQTSAGVVLPEPVPTAPMTGHES